MFDGMPVAEMVARLRISLAKSGVPEHNHSWLIDYLTIGQRCEDFLEAVLQNDLKEACLIADITNRIHIWDTVQWLYNNAPMISWGSPENYEAWLLGHRMNRNIAAETME